MVSYIGYHHKRRCSLCRGLQWRWLALCGCILMVLLLACLYMKQLPLIPHLLRSSNHVTSGHTQTRMFLEPPATAIDVPPNANHFIYGDDGDMQPIDALIISESGASRIAQNKSQVHQETKREAHPIHTTLPDQYASVDSVPVVKVQGVICDRLISGDSNALAQAASYQKNNTYVPVKDSEYIKLTSSCEMFRSSRHYMSEPVSSEEEEFSIAFSILVFKDVEQFERLLRAIYRPQNYYCIHVDLKSSVEVKSAVNSIARCFHNVFLASKSIDVQWGTYSVLEPEFICMENLWKYKKWKYFINLTGQEFPLKTNLDIVKILKAFNGANNMEGTVKRLSTLYLDTHFRRNKERTSFIHYGYSMTTQRKASPPIPVTLSKGSVHITASRAFVDYVLHDRRALLFREWIKDTGVPDETFFSSLNHSPQLGVPGAYLGEPETNSVRYPFITRFKNWGVYPFDWPCHGHRVRMVCVFGTGDLKLLSVRPELFANKFYLTFEPLTLSCLEELHYNRTRDEITGVRKFDVTPYKNLDFVKKHI